LLEKKSNQILSGPDCRQDRFIEMMLPAAAG
jgi:hypothetical protein